MGPLSGNVAKAIPRSHNEAATMRVLSWPIAKRLDSGGNDSFGLCLVSSIELLVGAHGLLTG